MGNQTGNTNKKTFTSKNTQTEEKFENMLGRKEQNDPIRANDTSQRDKSESTDERKKTKKILR